jgi:hypothetical protein
MLGQFDIDDLGRAGRRSQVRDLSELHGNLVRGRKRHADEESYEEKELKREHG